MIDVANLILKIDSGDVAGARAELAKFAAQSSDTEKASDRLQAGWKRLAVVAGPAVLGAAFASALKGAVDLQDQYVRLSEIAGTTASVISSLDLPARLSGTSLESVASSIARLGKSIGEARLGDVQKQGLFKALGIDPADGRDAVSVMQDVARATVSMKDQNVAAAVTQGLLGRGFSEMRPFMKEIVEQGTLYARVTDEDAKRAKEFNDNITKLTFNFQNGKIALANEYLPALNAVIEAMVRAQKEGATLAAVLSAGIRQALTGDDLAKATKEIADINRQIAELQEKRKNAPQGNQQYLARIDAAVAALNEKLRIATQYKAQLENPEDFSGPARPRPGSAGGAMDMGVGLAEMNRGETDAERGVRELMEFNRTYDAKVAASKGFYERYAEAIKTGNQLTHEARKLGTIDEATMVAQLSANEDARLKVLRASLEEQKALHRRKGEGGKAEEASQEIEKVNAQIVANEAITTARLKSIRQEEGSAWKQDLASRTAALLEQSLTQTQILEQQYTERQNLLDMAVNEGLITDEQWQAQSAMIFSYYEKEKTRISDEETARRYKIAKVYRELDLDSTSEFLNIMSGMMTSSNRKMFEVGKAAAISKTIIDTYQAAQGAYASLASIPYVGPVLGAAAAAAAIVAGIARVQQIRNTPFGGGGSPSGAGTYSVSPSTGLPAAPIQPTREQSKQTTVINFTGTTDERKLLRRFVDMLNENSADGGRVIVGSEA